MGLGLGTILYVSLLLINAVAILNEERFLARIGWSSAGYQPGQQFAGQYDNTGFGDQGGPGVKSRLINLIGAVRTLLRIPLIIINIVVILYELVLG
ncbi:transporter protein YOS1 [Ceratobasidium sp. AG-Ba]|nr:transporter protein YOS1 [Ceratobasidium sp. AG-Ba]QRV87784.1 transporter protein YOS1 [Ceratobasidium sp. AG-Ba]